MPARRRQRDPSALKTVRLRVEPRLTQAEARELEAQAAADFRSVGNYVAWLIAQNQRAKRQARSRTKAKPGDKRVGYSINVPITIPDRRELEERARAELRSLSGYVARLIVEDLSAGR